MQRRVFWLWLGLLLAGGAWAAPPAGQELDELLLLQDRLVVEQFTRQFPVDRRYDEVLSRIAGRTAPHVAEVFPGEAETVYFVVVLSNLGFNAVSWHRVVIVDTLLLDGLKRFSQGIVVYGGLDNPYGRGLAAQLHQLAVRGELGGPLRSRFDPHNPYALLPPPGLTPDQARRAEAVFEELLAAWMCHEVSHAYLGHARMRLLKAWDLEKADQARTNPLILRQQIEHYLDFQLGPANELEADRAGAALALRSGYGLEGFCYNFEIIRQLEHLSGADTQYYRSHPYPEDRIRVVLAVERGLREPRPPLGVPPGSLTR
ncbi:MAG: M48 family metalloprotease [Candidatus Eremiobacterota bacterium]